MPSIVLRKITEPITEKNIFDISSPLSFKQWLSVNIGIIPDDAENQYQQYLINFYSKKSDKKTVQTQTLKNDYLALVEKLSIIFKDDTEFQRFSNIDFSDKVQLKIAIPYFAKKLKEIAIYYANSREKVKRAKEEYSNIGSELGLERFLYRNLVELFSKNRFQNSLVVQNSSITPDLSALSSEFELKIEELYDLTNHFQEQEALATNPLFCVLTDYVSNLCQFSDSLSLSGTPDTENLLYLCEDEQLTNDDLIRSGWSKYLGTNINYISGGYFAQDVRPVSLSLQQGNNFFYWFSGERVQEIAEGIFENIPLSSIDWTNATAADTYQNSDLIFVSNGNTNTQAAWLMSADNQLFDTVMSATMTNDKEFKFPYPGFGLSAEGLNWSGRQITDLTEDDRRFFPNELTFQNTLKEIEKMYWSASFTNSSCEPLLLQETTLAEQGAFASNHFKNADKIYFKKSTNANKVNDGSPDEIFTDEIGIAWLYKFNQTQIPINVGANNIYYPLTAFENSDDLFFRYENGDAVALSALAVNDSFVGAIANTDFDNSDVLIKLQTVCGPEIEAAWLSGPTLSSFNFNNSTECACSSGNTVYFTGWELDAGTAQSHLSFALNPGESTRFVWTADDKNINDIKALTGFKHDDACPYLQLNHKKSILDNNFLNISNTEEFEKWRKCDCRSVHYSPLGHNGTSINTYGAVGDFIIEDDNKDAKFNFVLWRGADGKNYLESRNIAWFKLADSIEKDFGWGFGNWVRNDGTPFVLQKGKSYIYYRSNLNRCNFELPGITVREGLVNNFISKTCNQISNIPVWKKAIKNADNEWIKTDEVTDMTLRYGEFYSYIHRDNYSYTFRKVQYNNQDIDTLSGNFVVLPTSDTNVSYKVISESIPSLPFVIKIPLTNNKPYWAKASYSPQDKKVYKDFDNNRLWGNSIQLTQPIPSDLVLTEQQYIRYELSPCNECFIWKQPVTFSVKEPIIRWNRILIDDCVTSEILNFLQERSNQPCSSDTFLCNSNCTQESICGCANLCEPTRIGVTATNIPSDIILNTELSGLPTFVNYFGRNDFDLSFTVKEISDEGTWISAISGSLVEAQEPWKNLINDEEAKFVYEQSANNLFSRKELGLFIPSRINQGKYELKNADVAFVNDDASLKTFRADSFDFPYSAVNIDSSWMKKQNGLPWVKGRQTFYPYNSLDTEYGLFNANQTNNFELSANVVEWQTDLNGTQYFLTNETQTRFTNTGVNSLWIKSGDTLSAGYPALSSIFEKYKNVYFDAVAVSAMSAYLATENSFIITTEDGLLLVIG